MTDPVTDNVIEVRGLKNQFGTHVVHENLDLDLRRGEILGIVGGSGYLKKYAFDKRFSKTPPPNYPKLVDELEWTEWDG